MPYIPKQDREAAADLPNTAGELNFAMTLTAITYVEGKGLSYQTINDVMGAFEGAKQEFYRRVAIPYENSKISQNGDVYSPSLAPFDPSTNLQLAPTPKE